MAAVFGDSSNAGKHLVYPSVFLQSSCESGLVGEVEVSLQEAEAGGGPALQRQVRTVVSSLPDSAIISGQSPLQVGHGHGLLEVNHSIGV